MLAVAQVFDARKRSALSATLIGIAQPTLPELLADLFGQALCPLALLTQRVALKQLFFGTNRRVQLVELAPLVTYPGKLRTC